MSDLPWPLIIAIYISIAMICIGYFMGKRHSPLEDSADRPGDLLGKLGVLSFIFLMVLGLILKFLR